jgi:hypothetical protein
MMMMANGRRSSCSVAAWPQQMAQHELEPVFDSSQKPVVLGPFPTKAPLALEGDTA